MKNRIIGEYDGYVFKYNPNPTKEEKLNAAKKGLQNIKNAKQQNIYAEFPKYLKYLEKKEKEYSDFINDNS
jgi:hypothetical protein